MTILEDFLLFHFSDAYKFGDTVLKICTSAAVPIFILSLLIDRFKLTNRPVQILKRFLIAQFILMFIPLYFKPVSTFGMKVGNSILKDIPSKKGIIANWLKLRDKAQKDIKTKKEPNIIDTTSAFFSFDGTNIVEKSAAILIFFLIMLVKVTFSSVYYLTYVSIGFLTVLWIFPFFPNHLTGAGKSILYLIITPILVALILVFMNSTLQFEVDKDGFLTGLSSIAQFLVLCFLLLGSLSISKSLVSGIGAEDWGAQMSSTFTRAATYKTISLAQSLATKNSLASGISKSSSFVHSALGNSALKTVGYVASRPFATASKGFKEGLRDSINSKAKSIYEKKGANVTNNSANKNNTSNFQANAHKSSPVFNGRYENAFSKVLNENGKNKTLSSISPITHLKASSIATKGMLKEVNFRAKNQIGLPNNIQNLTFKEKSVFVAQKALGSNQKIKESDLVKSQIIANNITNNTKPNTES